MFLNVLSFKNGKTIPFQTETPFSVDKVAENWNVIIDESNGQTVSFRGSEIVTIASQDVTKLEKTGNRSARRSQAKRSGKKPAIKTEITRE